MTEIHTDKTPQMRNLPLHAQPGGPTLPAARLRRPYKARPAPPRPAQAPSREDSVELSRLLVPEGANGAYGGKRIFDCAVASLMLLLLLPVMALTWLAVRLTSKGPGLLWSDRIGRFGRVFQMPKFRSMRVDAPMAPRESLPDPRIFDTPIGLFLRQTALDELPQLWSVVIGDMSLVGPRPLIRQDTEMHLLRGKASVYRARPGMTGAAQVNGRNLVDNKAKVALDQQYVERCSFWVDMGIIIKTVLVLARPSMVLM
jgi:O-antigen biosynthesis protein WbqP